MVRVTGLQARQSLPITARTDLLPKLGEFPDLLGRAEESTVG